MKKLFLFLVPLAIIVGCSKNNVTEKPKEKTIEEILAGTSWKGSCSVYESDKYLDFVSVLHFTSENTGTHRLFRRESHKSNLTDKSGPYDKNNIFELYNSYYVEYKNRKTSFTYYVKDNMIYVNVPVRVVKSPPYYTVSDITLIMAIENNADGSLKKLYALNREDYWEIGKTFSPDDILYQK